MLVVHMNRKHDSEVCLSLHMLLMIQLGFGMVLVVWMREQRRNSTNFAQASYSRLSESCRILILVLV